MASVFQPWVSEITLMQQTVMMTAIRGPDGTPKYGAAKMLLRWYRRCILLSALDQAVLADPMCDGGGSFTGPSISRDRLVTAFRERSAAANADWNEDIRDNGEPLVISFPDDRNPFALSLAELIEDQQNEDGWEPLMHEVLRDYLRELDALPHHFQLHFLHAAEILGFKHPDRRIRGWWAQVYERLVEDMHLWPETEAQMDMRLGDNREGWLARADPATVE